MKILLIGGTGFIGNYLYDDLKRDHEIQRTYSSSKTDNGLYYDSNIHSLNDILSSDYDIVINNINPLALPYHSFIRTIEELAHYCKTKNCWLINISSVFADEINKYNNSYSMKKHIADEIILQEMGFTNATIMRFPQVFDAKGLGRESQNGLYFIMDSVSNFKPISIFSNSETMLRNYLPVSLLISSIRQTIDSCIFGLHNIYVPYHTMSMYDIIHAIAGFNANYDKRTLLIKSDRSGSEYILPTLSQRFSVWSESAESLRYYLLKAYNEEE